MRRFILALLCLLTVSACGIKPSEVELPEEVESGDFPRTYPDISTDPPPYVPPQ